MVAVVCGLGAFTLVRSYETEVDRLRPAVGAPVPVVVAASAIARAMPIVADAVDVRLVPSSFAPPGRFTRVDAVIGRTTLTALRPGEAVTDTRLAPPGGPIAAVAPPGTVGVPVAVDLPFKAVRPGDRVDVLATFGGHRPHTETVAEEVEVLLVISGSSATAPDLGGSSAPTLVLAATPDLAERLAYAAAFATLAVAVRPAASGDVVPTA